MSLYTGFKTLSIGYDGMPTDMNTGWWASCLIILGYVVYIGEVFFDDSDVEDDA